MMPGDLAKFVAAAKSLLDACEEEFGGDEMSEFPDDCAVMSDECEDSPITFGMLRRLRAELDQMEDGLQCSAS